MQLRRMQQQRAMQQQQQQQRATGVPPGQAPVPPLPHNTRVPNQPPAKMTGPPTTQHSGSNSSNNNATSIMMMDAAARKPKRTLSMTRPERTHSGGLLRESHQGLHDHHSNNANGELTLEEYRQQLEAYISNTQDHHNDHQDDCDIDGDASDLEDDWEKEREKNFDSQAQRRAPPGRQRSSRGVDRAKSGVSMMSIATNKSGGGMSMVSGFTNLSDLMSATDDVSGGEHLGTVGNKAAGGARDPSRGVDRNQSNLSIMSELTDLSANIDNLSLYED